MTKSVKIIIGIVGAIVLIPFIAGAKTTTSISTFSYLGMSGLPRGLRNNNPGNIRISNNAWKGKVANNTDGAFEQFQYYVYGIRAMIKNLLSYGRDGLSKLDEVLYRWAPPSDGNDTEAYIEFVSQYSGIPRNATIDFNSKTQMRALVQAMTTMENYGPNFNKNPVTDAQFNYAWSII